MTKNTKAKEYDKEYKSKEITPLEAVVWSISRRDQNKHPVTWDRQSAIEKNNESTKNQIREPMSL